MILIAIASALALALGIRTPKTLLMTWLADWHKSLRKYVKDDTRRAEAASILDTHAEELERYFQQVDEILARAYEVQRSYDATASDYQPALDAYMDRLRTTQHHHLATVLQIHDVLEPAEWSAIQAKVQRQLQTYWKRYDRRATRHEAV
jgi:hypothetical protein